MTATLSKATVESKAVLARMLATENLSVEHNPKAETAYFDVQNRKLVFPCWEGMTDHLYDMLAGHETAHALFTPAGEAALFEAIKAVDPRPEAASAVKGYLNIVEDARIERLVKEKYPGLRRTFFLAYQDLVKSDLMAPAVNQIATLRLIDRANMHYKVGTFVDVPFTEAEFGMVERMASTKTFDDVVALAREMWEYEKEEKKKQEQEEQQSQSQKTEASQDNEGEGQGGEGESSGEQQQSEETAEGTKPTEKKPAEEKKGQGKPEAQESASESSEESKGSGNSSDSEGSDPMPEASKTDGMLNEYSRSKTNKRAKYFVTADLPKFNVQKGVIPASVVIPMMVELGENNNGLAEFTEWKNRNAESVAVLCREFERRRAAEAASRTSMSDSGAIDVNRLWSYRVSDEIFRQYANVKNGQSHGIQVFVDFSGSMSGILYETLSQMASLAAFCRRMNIPFDVYAFTDGLNRNWISNATSEEWDKMTWQEREENTNAWECGKNTMQISGCHFRLVHLLTSGMSERNFRMAVGGMLAAASRKLASRYYYGPQSEEKNGAQLFRLNGTPTNQATLAAMTIIPEFRKKNNLQIVHAVFLTDGEAGDRFSGPNENNFYSNNEIYGYTLRDSVTGNMEKCEGSYCTTSQNRALNHLLAKRGFNVIGISLCPTREFRSKMQDGQAKRKGNNYDNEMEAAKTKGFCEAEDCYGYTKWFGMNAPHLDENDYFVGITETAPKSVLTKAFAKTIKQGTMNRLLLSRFVDMIASHAKKI